MAGERILVIEDNPLNLELVRALLQKLGYVVIDAGTAEEGIERAKADQPHLILMDVNLPGMDGLTATTMLKSDAATKHIPVILCTSKNLETDRIWGVRQGAKDYVLKPVDEKDLLKKITALR